MIAKAQIKEIIGKKFLVRVPLFESAGNPQEVTLLATLCYQPGNLESYKVGDVVFVAFENGEFSNAVIIGKLYLGLETETNSYSYNAALKAVVSAELPRKTSIGDFSADEVYTALRNDPIHEERLTEVEANVKTIVDILSEGGISSYGLKIVGKVNSTAFLPTPTQYKQDHPDWEYGDAYLVGTDSYHAYILLRGSNSSSDYWFDIGAFPVQGPKGDTGATGPQGDQGPSGTIAFGSMAVTTTEPGTDANVTFTNIGTASNAVYNLHWYIPQGADGEQGIQGEQGPQGEQGEDGDPAGFGTITATATTLGSDASATVSISTSGPDTAKNMQFDFGIPKGAEVVFENDEYSTGWVDVNFKNFTDKKITNSATTTTVRFVIPSGVNQGWAGSATLKLTTPPTFTVATPGSTFPYDIYYILDGYQKNLSDWQTSLESNITLELMAECNGFDIRIYGKQTKDY